MNDGAEYKAKVKAALLRYPEAKKAGGSRETDAIDRALDRQREYYNGEARVKMVELVYFKGTHTLAGAAVATGYAEETVKKWNLELLSNIDGRLDRPEA
jgi:hypothetical protein